MVRDKHGEPLFQTAGPCSGTLETLGSSIPLFLPTGGLIVAPNGFAIAVLDSTATCLTILHARAESGSDQLAPGDPASVAPCEAVRRFLPTRLTPNNSTEPDVVYSWAWGPDSSRLAVACASGHVYILDRYQCNSVSSGTLSQRACTGGTQEPYPASTIWAQYVHNNPTPQSRGTLPATHVHPTPTCTGLPSPWQCWSRPCTPGATRPSAPWLCQRPTVSWLQPPTSPPCTPFPWVPHPASRPPPDPNRCPASTPPSAAAPMTQPAAPWCWWARGPHPPPSASAHGRWSCRRPRRRHPRRHRRSQAVRRHRRLRLRHPQ